MDVELATHRENLARSLDLLREGASLTFSELSELSGCSESIIDDCVRELLGCALITEDRDVDEPAPPARAITFCADGGIVLVADLGTSRTSVGAADLSGRLIDRLSGPTDLSGSPEPALANLERLLKQLLLDLPTDAPIRGIGVGVLGAVDSVSGRTLGDPLLAGWDRYPIRDRLASTFDVPVWVDNDVNMMAVGELKAGAGRGQHNLIYLNMSETIRAGIVSNGRLHRGEGGAAGEIGHVTVVEEPPIPCWCGGQGCLVRLAGGDVLAASAALLAGQHGPLANHIADHGHLTAHDVADAARAGDPVCTELISRAGILTGKALANLVNTFNPGQILIGGTMAAAGETLLTAIQNAVYQRAIPAATRHLEIQYSPESDTAALLGAAHTVIDQLLSRDILSVWSPHGSPTGLAAEIHQLQHQ